MSVAVVTPRIEIWAPAAATCLAAAVVLFGHQALPVLPIVGFGLGATVFWILWQDVRTLTISDLAVLTFAVLALAYRWSAARPVGTSAGQTLVEIGLDALVPGALLLAFRELYYRRKGFDGLGLGDVKLAAAGGILVGLIGFSYALLGASLLALIVVAVRRLTAKPVGAMEKLAFGAFLAPALFAVWLLEQVPAFAAFVET